MKIVGRLHFFAEPGEEGGLWSVRDSAVEDYYQGLHILTTGDTLIIYDWSNPFQAVWQGDVDLKPLGKYSRDAYGMWIRYEQRGTDRQEWARMFLEEYPAQLTTEEV